MISFSLAKENLHECRQMVDHKDLQQSKHTNLEHVFTVCPLSRDYFA